MEPNATPTQISDTDQAQWAQCRTENQRWTLTLTSYEQEIDELLDLLADAVTNQYRSLRHRAIDYTTALQSLKPRLLHIQRDLVCPLPSCVPATSGCSCGDAHFRRYISIPYQLNTLTEEYNRIKEGCYQLLSVMVQLNLI